MTTPLEIKQIWQAPGYRELSLTLIDPATRKEYRVQFMPTDMQRLINECADAVRQIGMGSPIDWDRYPTQIYWPTITPWRIPPRRAPAEKGGVS